MTVMSFPTELRSLLWRQRGLITWHRLTTAIKQLRTAHTLTRLSTLINITTCHLRDEFFQADHSQTYTHIDTHNRFTALFRDYPGEPVPEEIFWTLWCKGR